MSAPRVAIVGGGASGTLLAIQLVRQSRHPLDVTLIEPRTHLGRGVAYDTPEPAHLLNVPAGRMSALPDEPDHFARWLSRCGVRDPKDRYVQRHLYGLYLEDTLAMARAQASPGVVATHLTGQVSRLVPGKHDVAVRVNGSTVPLRVEYAALALGNLGRAGIPAQIAAEPGYVVAPWSPGGLDVVSPDDRVLVLGSGLTMIDVTLALAARGRRAPIVALSRHGLLPQAHGVRPTDGPPALPLADLPAQLSVWLRAFRLALRSGADWRESVDGLRPVTSILWRRLPAAERRRFLRHVRPYWDVARHRMPPAVARQIAELRATGHLVVRAGRLTSVRRNGEHFAVELTARGSHTVETLGVRWIVDATGPEGDLARASSPFVRRLLRAGIVRRDELRLGADTTLDGRVIDAMGRPSDRVYALGPLRRGGLWESSAVPELREQAAAVAGRWLESLAFHEAVRADQHREGVAVRSADERRAGVRL